MTKKEELNDYEEDVALSKVNDMFEGGTVTGQDWRTSLFEAHANALFGAPIAILAHIGLLLWSGIEPNWENATVFATASWPVFFYLSVMRVFLFRRIFERYGVLLEPVTLIRKLVCLIKYGKLSKKQGRTEET